MSAKLKISVLIPTEKRPVQLRRCLLSLIESRSDLFDFEYIVGVNNNDFESEKIAQKLLENQSSKIILYPTKQTPACLRNELIPHCSGDFVFFIDDDAFVEKKYFSIFNDIYNKISLDVVGGPNLTPPQSSMWVRSVGYTLQSRFATLFSSARYNQKGELRLCDESCLILCNLFVKKSFLDKNAFLADLECGEESYLLQNLLKKGARIYYAPDLFVFHERRSDCISLAKQVYKYGFGRGQLARIGFRRINGAHAVPFLALTYFFVYIFSLPFFLSTWLHFPIVLYFLLLFFASLSLVLKNRNDKKAAFLSLFVFPVVHFSYAFGTLSGLMRGFK